MNTRTGVVGVAFIVAGGLSGCALPGSVAASPPPSPAVSSSSPTATPTPTATTATPTPTPSDRSVKATGRMDLFFNVSKALTGTCAVAEAGPTLTLSEKKNDFYGTVDVTIVLAPDGGAVVSLDAELGEDAELISRKLTYKDKPRAKGTSAVLVASDDVYTITGKAMVFENAATKGSLIPFKVTAKCAGSDWLE